MRLREDGYGNFEKAGNEVNIALNWLQRLRGKQLKDGAAGKGQKKGKGGDYEIPGLTRKGGEFGLGSVFKAMRARREQVSCGHSLVQRRVL